MYALQINDLTKIYRKRNLGKLQQTRGIENVSLNINKGEIFGLLGLNGSGKTTTIKLILGLLQPTKGSVSVLGARVPSTEILKQIGYLPEVPCFYPYLTAKEILKFYGKLSGVEKVNEKVDTILELVGLTRWKDKQISDFSKGMKQRIGLAQSLLHDPDVLVYDEPVSGLDPLAVQEMRNLILKLKQRGKTIFLSSHLISEVEKVCDNVGILVKGRLVRVLNQSEWQKKEGELENIFVSDVVDSSEVGRIKI